MFTLRFPRSIAILAIATILLSGVLAIVFGTSSASAQVTDPPEYICHAAGRSGKFVKVPAADAGIAMGHYGPGHQWGNDIIPPTTYQGSVYSQNWDAQGQAIWGNDCVNPTPIVVLPGVTVVQQTCDVVASLTTVPVVGVTYSQSGPATPGGSVIVTAILDNPFVYTWGVLPVGWTENEEGNAVYTANFTAAPDCREVATPTVATFVDATCDVQPSVTLPANGGGITYAQDVAAAPGVTVTVSATIDLATHRWGDTSGWLPNPAGETATITMVFQFADPSCPTATATVTPTATSTITPTATETETVSPTATGTASPTETATSTIGATNTPTKAVVTTLPDTGSGDDSSGAAVAILLTAAVAGGLTIIGLVQGNRRQGS